MASVSQEYLVFPTQLPAVLGDQHVLLFPPTDTLALGFAVHFHEML